MDNLKVNMQYSLKNIGAEVVKWLNRLWRGFKVLWIYCFKFKTGEFVVGYKISGKVFK
jgi:hypothetical protein